MNSRTLLGPRNDGIRRPFIRGIGAEFIGVRFADRVRSACEDDRRLAP